ncbi:MAG: glycosyltransferase family 4 protein [Candidatus Nanoarchaeia archaeon]
MKELKYITNDKIYKYDNKHYIQRAHFVNELSKHFNINYYGYLFKKNKLDLNKFQIIESSIYLKQISEFNTSRDKNNSLYFMHYPMGFKALYWGLKLRNNKCIFWVKGDVLGQYIHNGNFFTKPIRFLTYPIFKLFYDSISKFIFKNNLIFYTSNITTNQKNHLNQYEIISCSEFNRDKKLIKNTLTNKIFFVGGEENRKGLLLLLKALQHSNKELNIIGLDKLQRKQHQKLAKHVTIKFHGKIYNRKLFFEKLSRADIVVMPSFGEKQGKVQLEAMSVGAVPICADSGGTYRTIDNYYNGLLFKEGNWRELQKQINLLYKDKELYKDLKENGLEYIKTLSVEKQVEKMAKIINNYYK